MTWIRFRLRLQQGSRGAGFAPWRGMWYSPESLVTVVSLILLAPAGATSAHDAAAPVSISRASACDAAVPALPETIALADGLDAVVRHVLEHSPKFRQQCRQLAAAPHLRATVRVAFRQAGAFTRARTSFRRSEFGALDANIELGSVADLTELIAHEFEHLIEQLDGVDLKALSKEGQAHRLSDGAFETERAVAAGQRVAGEVVDNSPDRVRGAGGSVWRALRRVVGARQRRGSSRPSQEGFYSSSIVGSANTDALVAKAFHRRERRDRRGQQN